MKVNTIYGPMEEKLLEKREGIDENDNEQVKWVEYWRDGELVHRSVHLTLKKLSAMKGIIANLS